MTPNFIVFPLSNGLGAGGEMPWVPHSPEKASVYIIDLLPRLTSILLNYKTKFQKSVARDDFDRRIHWSRIPHAPYSIFSFVFSCYCQ